MSWQKKAGHDHDHIDGRTLVHNIHLFNSATGAEHNLHIQLKQPCCMTCRRPWSQADLAAWMGLEPGTPAYREPTDLHPGDALEEALEMLNPNHAAILEYSKRHNIPILLGDLASTAPDGHKAINAQGRRFLIPPRGKS